MGLGEAGKTSLLNALRQNYEQTYEAVSVTDGINIKDWVINLEDNSKLTFSMWDFGKSINKVNLTEIK